MTRYLFTRSLAALAQLSLVIVAVFVAIRLTGNPTDVLLGNYATEADHQRLAEALGLSEPLYVQFWRFLQALFKGDLGYSFSANRPVGPLIMQRLANSGKLAGASLLVILLWSLPLGVLAAKRKGTRVDSAAHFAAVAGFAIPNFFLGILLILVFAVFLGLLPTSGMGGWRHYVAPSIALGTAVGAGLMRLMRSGMLQAAEQPYILMAHAKGLRTRAITWRHEFRSALSPVLSYGGAYVGTLVGGSVVIEVVFAWPGLGILTYNAVLSRDFPVVQGVILLLGAVIIIANLLVDVAYAYIDPRVRVGQT